MSRVVGEYCGWGGVGSGCGLYEWGCKIMEEGNWLALCLGVHNKAVCV